MLIDCLQTQQLEILWTLLNYCVSVNTVKELMTQTCFWHCLFHLNGKILLSKLVKPVYQAPPSPLWIEISEDKPITALFPALLKYASSMS